MFGAFLPNTKMLKLFVVALAVVAVAADLETYRSAYKVKFNRKETWSKNKDDREKNNIRYKLGFSPYRSRSEFSLEGANHKDDLIGAAASSEGQKSLNSPFPASVDWRKQGYVTAVKNQGNCNAGWAFAATGVLEGYLANTTGELVSLSESNLIDCVSDSEARACKGGFPSAGLQYVSSQKAINTESSYPYTDKEGACKFNNATAAQIDFQIYQLFDLPEIYLQNAVAYHGPTSASMIIDTSSIYDYKGGIYDNPNCVKSPYSIPHGVLVVGYGTEEGKDYWIIKNSWGTSWGEEGYMRLARNKNMCGITGRLAYAFPPDPDDHLSTTG